MGSHSSPRTLLFLPRLLLHSGGSHSSPRAMILFLGTTIPFLGLLFQSKGMYVGPENLFHICTATFFVLQFIPKEPKQVNCIPGSHLFPVDVQTSPIVSTGHSCFFFYYIPNLSTYCVPVLVGIQNNNQGYTSRALQNSNLYWHLLLLVKTLTIHILHILVQN